MLPVFAQRCPLTAREVFDAALSANGMLPFLSLVGRAIRDGRAGPAIRVLERAGLGPSRAWILVDGWEAAEARETETGWAAETVAAAFVIHDVEGWRNVEWRGLSIDLLAAQVPSAG